MAKDPAVIEALKKLRDDPEALAWTKRRDLGSMLDGLFKDGKGDENAVALATLLASDKRWEVRKTIANFLISLPEETQVRLLAQFLQDDNAFVRKAADRVIDHRRRTRQVRARQQRGLEQVRREFSELEKKHGASAAKKARRVIERMYEMMARTASHELLGRMTPLKSDATRLLAKIDNKEIDLVDFGKTLRNAQERLDFIERFLQNLKLHAQTLPEERTRENLADVVAEARRAALEKLRAGDLDGKKITFNATIPANLYVDMSRIHVVVAMSDLIKNAFEAFKDYSPKDGAPSVSVDARRIADERIQIKITDNGCGLVADDLADVREFIPGKSSKKIQGTGFGVPNARRIVLEHNGEFEFQSAAEKGTGVTIVLPLRKKDSTDEA